MAVITFYTNGEDQVGNTTSAMALATYLGITKNKRTLLISTSLNDETVRKAFWPEERKRRSGLFGPNTQMTVENGIEGLDRIVRSNKISPDIITDYTKVALKDRLEILLGYKGDKETYKEIQKRYVQIIILASKYYDNVIIDLDKKLEENIKIEILSTSDIIIGMTNQKVDNINKLAKEISEGELLKDINTLVVFGRYDDKSKYNAKNVTRSMLKQRNIINTIPYNTLLLESTQEGAIIDMFLGFLRLKGRDENTFFMDELKRLSEDIEYKVARLQLMGA